MDLHERLIRLVELLYAAPGTTHGWNSFLDCLRIELNGAVANLISHDLRLKRGHMLAVVGADPDGMRLYQQHWSAQDPWAYSPKRALLGPGDVSVGDALVPHYDIVRTAFHQDFGRHYDIVRMLGGVIESDTEATSVLSMTRGEKGEPFGRHDVELFRHLLPHMRRALHLHRRIVEAEVVSGDLTEIVHRLPQAAFFVDLAGRVTFANRAASTLAASRDGLSLDRGELRAARMVDTMRLRELIADAVQASRSVAAGAGGTMTIGRPSGRRSFVVTVSPAPRRSSIYAEHGAAAWVFVTDPDGTRLAEDHDLRQLYGFTQAEAALARYLADGHSLSDAASRLGVRRSTARSRLKDVFAKTHTHRQAELVRVLLSGAGHG